MVRQRQHQQSILPSSTGRGGGVTINNTSPFDASTGDLEERLEPVRQVRFRNPRANQHHHRNGRFRGGMNVGSPHHQPQPHPNNRYNHEEVKLIATTTRGAMHGGIGGTNDTDAAFPLPQQRTSVAASQSSSSASSSSSTAGAASASSSTSAVKEAEAGVVAVAAGLAAAAADKKKKKRKKLAVKSSSLRNLLGKAKATESSSQQQRPMLTAKSASHRNLTLTTTPPKQRPMPSSKSSSLRNLLGKPTASSSSSSSTAADRPTLTVKKSSLRNLLGAKSTTTPPAGGNSERPMLTAKSGSLRNLLGGNKSSPTPTPPKQRPMLTAKSGSLRKLLQPSRTPSSSTSKPPPTQRPMLASKSVSLRNVIVGKPITTTEQQPMTTPLKRSGSLGNLQGEGKAPSSPVPQRAPRPKHLLLQHKNSLESLGIEKDDDDDDDSVSSHASNEQQDQGEQRPLPVNGNAAIPCTITGRRQRPRRTYLDYPPSQAVQVSGAGAASVAVATNGGTEDAVDSHVAVSRSAHPNQQQQREAVRGTVPSSSSSDGSSAEESAAADNADASGSSSATPATATNHRMLLFRQGSKKFWTSSQRQLQQETAKGSNDPNTATPITPSPTGPPIRINNSSNINTTNKRNLMTRGMSTSCVVTSSSSATPMTAGGGNLIRKQSWVRTASSSNLMGGLRIPRRKDSARDLAPILQQQQTEDHHQQQEQRRVEHNVARSSSSSGSSSSSTSQSLDNNNNSSDPSGGASSSPVRESTMTLDRRDRDAAVSSAAAAADQSLLSFEQEEAAAAATEEAPQAASSSPGDCGIVPPSSPPSNKNKHKKNSLLKRIFRRSNRSLMAEDALLEDEEAQPKFSDDDFKKLSEQRNAYSSRTMLAPGMVHSNTTASTVLDDYSLDFDEEDDDNDEHGSIHSHSASSMDAMLREEQPQDDAYLTPRRQIKTTILRSSPLSSQDDAYLTPRRQILRSSPRSQQQPADRWSPTVQEQNQYPPRRSPQPSSLSSSKQQQPSPITPPQALAPSPLSKSSPLLRNGSPHMAAAQRPPSAPNRTRSFGADELPSAPARRRSRDEEDDTSNSSSSSEDVPTPTTGEDRWGEVSQELEPELHDQAGPGGLVKCPYQQQQQVNEDSVVTFMRGMFADRSESSSDCGLSKCNAQTNDNDVVQTNDNDGGLHHTPTLSHNQTADAKSPVNQPQRLTHSSMIIDSSDCSGNTYADNEHNDDEDDDDEDDNADIPPPPCASLSGRRAVSFDQIEIREYERTIGDNPSCTSGPPIGIGWSWVQSHQSRLEEYERSRPERKTKRQLYMTASKRSSLLTQEWEYDQEQVRQARREATLIQNQRAAGKGNPTGQAQPTAIVRKYNRHRLSTQQQQQQQQRQPQFQRQQQYVPQGAGGGGTDDVVVARNGSGKAYDYSQPPPNNDRRVRRLSPVRSVQQQQQQERRRRRLSPARLSPTGLSPTRLSPARSSSPRRLSPTRLSPTRLSPPPPEPVDEEELAAAPSGPRVCLLRTMSSDL